MKNIRTVIITQVEDRGVDKLKITCIDHTTGKSKGCVRPFKGNKDINKDWWKDEA